jgi:preprotein translocase subunit YajC
MAILAMSPMGILPMVCFFFFSLAQQRQQQKQRHGQDAHATFGLPSGECRPFCPKEQQ